MLLFGELTKEEKIKGYSTAVAGIEGLFLKTGSCICLLCVSVIFCQQGHVHDRVLLSQDRNYTSFY